MFIAYIAAVSNASRKGCCEVSRVASLAPFGLCFLALRRTACFMCSIGFVQCFMHVQKQEKENRTPSCRSMFECFIMFPFAKGFPEFPGSQPPQRPLLSALRAVLRIWTTLNLPQAPMDGMSYLETYHQSRCKLQLIEFLNFGGLKSANLNAIS